MSGKGKPAGVAADPVLDAPAVRPHDGVLKLRPYLQCRRHGPGRHLGSHLGTADPDQSQLMLEQRLLTFCCMGLCLRVRRPLAGGVEGAEEDGSDMDFEVPAERRT